MEWEDRGPSKISVHELGMNNVCPFVGHIFINKLHFYTHLSPCATSASRALLPATTTRFSVSRASMLPPCQPIAFIKSGTTWKQNHQK